MTTTLPPSPEPRGEPLLHRCRACGADISKVTYAGMVLLPQLREMPTRFAGGRVVPGGMSLVIEPQLIVLNPLRCPECNHPTMYLEQQRVVPAGPSV